LPTLPHQFANPRRRRLFAGLSMVLGALAIIVLRVFNPASTWFFPPCPFRALTGYLCPGCGTLRALHELLHGNVIAALRLNPVMMLLLPYVSYCGVSEIGEVILGRPLPQLFLRPILIWILLAVILVFWVLRNLPLIYPA